MKIKDIMTDRTAFVGPDSTIYEAAQLMQKHDIGAVPVCREQNVIGIVTDRDIVVRNIAHGKDPRQTPVKDVMSTQVTTVSPEMSVDDATQIMAGQQVRRLPVVDNEKLVGMVSLGDFAAKAKYDVEVAETLGDVSTPSEPEKMG